MEIDAMRTISIVLSLCLLIGVANANAPSKLAYQGRLLDTLGNPVTDGNYSVTFTIYDANVGGDSKWSETKSVATIDGLFSTVLGSVTPIDDTVFSALPRFLGMSIGVDAESVPREELVSMPYALHANTAAVAQSLAGGSASAWSIGGDLNDLYTGSGALASYPHEDYEYGIKYLDIVIKPAICTKWNLGLRFYNIEPFFVDSDDPSTGMKWGGVMFFIDTNSPLDDASTPSQWRHAWWYIDFTASTTPMRDRAQAE